MGKHKKSKKSKRCSITDILESIALEEAGIAHVLNAEGEKIQAVQVGLLNGQISSEQAIEVQKTVDKTLRSTIKMQMLLQFKLEDTLEAIRQFSSSSAECCSSGSEWCFECSDSSGHSSNHVRHRKVR